MAVGSAFDAYVKAFLAKALFGSGIDFNSLFEQQVEEHNRDFAQKAGAKVFLAYKESGSLVDLLRILETAREPPRMEFTQQERILADGDHTNPVVILGKPDLYFITKEGLPVVLDWKVNGFCSDTGASPAQGYIVIKGQCRNHGSAHHSACIWHEKDLLINADPNLEKYKPDWATQIAVYSWLCGAKVGEQVIAAVDQIVCKPDGISVAQHRCEITEGFQRKVHAEFQECWDIVHSDHIFRDVSYELSKARCQMLATQALAFEDPFMREISGRAAQRPY